MLAQVKSKLSKAVGPTAAERRLQSLVRRGRVTIGRHSYELREVQIVAGDTKTCLRIGNFVSIAGDVQFLLGANHRVDRSTTFPSRKVLGVPSADADVHPASRGDVVVGNDVWLGVGAKILSGVVIGDGAVVGRAFYRHALGPPLRRRRRIASPGGNAALQRRSRRASAERGLVELERQQGPLRNGTTSRPDIEAFLARHES